MCRSCSPACGPARSCTKQLVARDEWREADPAPGVIAVASPPRGLAELHEIMERLCLLAREGADAAVREALFAAVDAERE